MYVGFFIAFCFLVFATVTRKSDIIRAILLVLAFLALVGQGGCFMVLGGIGTATGGSDIGADKMMVPVKWAFIIAFAWCLFLIFLIPLKENNSKSRNSDPSKNIPEKLRCLGCGTIIDSKQQCCAAGK
jgi:hypothetical protein